MYLLKSGRVSFYVSDKRCHIRVTDLSHKCWQILVSWRASLENNQATSPCFCFISTIQRHLGADTLDCELSTIICCAIYTIKCICHIKLSHKNCSCRRGFTPLLKLCIFVMRNSSPLIIKTQRFSFSGFRLFLGYKRGPTVFGS